MMQWSDVQLEPSSRTLRQFAGLWIIVFSAFAFWKGVVQNRPMLAIVVTLLALTIGTLGLWRPHAIRLLFVGWMVVAFPIGWLMSHFILACLFYGMFTPVGFVFRVLGRDALSLRRRRDGETYWARRSSQSDIRSYFHQY